MNKGTTDNPVREHILRHTENKTLVNAIKRVLNLLMDSSCQFFYRKEPPLHSNLLNIGCNEDKRANWVNADRLFYDGKFISADWTLDASNHWKCSNDRWDGIFTEHMIEHLSYQGAITMLSEALRTLKPGKWIRIVVPDVSQYVDFYNGNKVNDDFQKFHFGAIAISNLTQCWAHISVWDEVLFAAVLTEIGFVNVAKVSFGQGTDHQLIVDKAERRVESLYMEAQKPLSKLSEK